jgi:aspartate racemase
MKTLGLIGGTSWVSTVDYYRVLNEQINRRLGGLNGARLFLYSLNYEEFKPPVKTEDWDNYSLRLTDIAKKLEHAGRMHYPLCQHTTHGCGLYSAANKNTINTYC